MSKKKYKIIIKIVLINTYNNTNNINYDNSYVGMTIFSELA